MAFILKRDCYANPFNAINMEHLPDGYNHLTQDLRAELKRRGLKDVGDKERITKRLKRHNQWLLTPDGIYDVHLRKLKDVIQERQVSFNGFPKLPTEIRLMIWELSLPGARVLHVSDRRVFKDKLYFRKDDNPANPAALFTCQESRAVALERYRLCFGTTNVFADLSGGDILYFSNRLTNVIEFLRDSSSIWRWKMENNKKKEPKKVSSDLRKIKHLALHPDCWGRYRTRARGIVDGGNLRTDLRGFDKLERLLLVERDADSASSRGLFSSTPGHIDLEVIKEEGRVSWRQPTINALRKEFQENRMTEGEKVKGIPKVQVVNAHRITKVPGEDWELNWGEPYYPVLAVSSNASTSKREE